MKVSVNTAVFLDKMQNEVSQFDCLKELIGKPVQDIEVRGEFFKEDTRDEELGLIKQRCIEQGWDFYFSIPEELFTDGKLNQNIFDYIKMAQKYSIKGLKISLGSFTVLNDDEVQQLQNELQRVDVKVTVENQPNANGGLATFEKNLAVILNRVPELGYTFDSGNWYWIDEKPEEAFNALKEAITIFHLKDIKDQDTVMLGKGMTDWEKLVNELNADIPVFLEYAIEEEALDQEIEKVNLKLK